MDRRCFLIGCMVAAKAGAADDSSILQVFEPLASALSNGDAEMFLKPIDRAMPGYDKLRENVSALMSDFDITSSIEFVRAEAGKVELDWYLELRNKGDGGASEQRRQMVTARVQKKRILSIEPIEFFAPKAGSK
jgi:hypothetical protein